VQLVEFAERLIRTESITGNETAVAALAAEALEHDGFQVVRMEAGSGRHNVFAFHDPPRAVLSTHMDTVSPFVPFRREGEWLCGRGACDAKGILSAMACAALSLAREGHRDVGLLLVVGEERGSDGAKAANAWPNRCEFLINGEPTENRLALGSKGAVRFLIRASGRAAHSSVPETGDSAVLKLLDVLEDLRRIRWPAHPVLGEPSLNVGTLRGGTLANVVPDRAESECMLRTVENTSAVKRAIESAVRGRAAIHYLFECDPVLFERVEGFDTMVASFTTDIPLLTKWGRPFLLGPGSIRHAHSDDERISVAELERSVELYRRLTLALLARPKGSA
jgi:acetylornithine deacetylase